MKYSRVLSGHNKLSTLLTLPDSFQAWPPLALLNVYKFTTAATSDPGEYFTVRIVHPESARARKRVRFRSPGASPAGSQSSTDGGLSEGDGQRVLEPLCRLRNHGRRSWPLAGRRANYCPPDGHCGTFWPLVSTKSDLGNRFRHGRALVVVGNSDANWK